jgi:hypothetical protein
MDPAVELWGTFAVADHLRPAPFVTDVLLYDRLVIPVPEQGHRDKEWSTCWRASALMPLVDVLDDLAVPMPWGEAQAAQAVDRHGAALAVERDVAATKQVDPDAPAYFVTRAMLADWANREADDALFARLRALSKDPGTTVRAVTAYGSAVELEAGLGLEPAPAADPAPQRAAAVFDWVVHPPVGDDDLTILRHAVGLARRADFREHRRWFYARLQELESLAIEDVRRELARRLADYERIMRAQGWHTAARRATQVLLIAPGLIAQIEPISAALVGAAVGGAAYYVGEHMPRADPDAKTRVAAMAWDVQRAMGGRLTMAGARP